MSPDTFMRGSGKVFDSVEVIGRGSWPSGDGQGAKPHRGMHIRGRDGEVRTAGRGLS